MDGAVAQSVELADITEIRDLYAISTPSPEIDLELICGAQYFGGMTILSSRLDAPVPSSTNNWFAAAPIERRCPSKDERWPAIAAALADMRAAKRYSVRIVDADCGAGSLLLHAVRHARALGFTAIEARGIDGVPALIGRARVAAANIADRAIGITFETANLATALAEEQEFPADIILWHGHEAGVDQAAVARAVAAAGRLVITDRTPALGAAA